MKYQIRFDKKEVSIIHRFLKIVEEFKDKTAVTDKGISLTYNELDVLSNNVAEKLLQNFYNQEKPVGIFCRHNANAIVMIFGVLKVGGFFVYLDPNLPDLRLKRILNEIQPGIVITECEEENFLECFGNNIIRIGITEDNISATSKEVNNELVSLQDPACIIYTSGTTGIPNGVVLNHDNILKRVIRVSEDLQINSKDNLSLIQPIGVNAGIRDIFSAILNGAKLSIYNINSFGINNLNRWVSDQKITHFYTVPSLWRLINELVEDWDLSTLRIIRLGGEFYFRD